MNDLEYLKNLYAQIEIKLGWGDSKDWTHGQFSKLSELIFQESKVNISAGTLKRLFGKVKTHEEYNPQIDTKNALSIFLEYSDWNAFKNAQVKTDFKKVGIKEYKNYLVVFGISIVLLCIAAYIFFPSSKKLKISFSSSKKSGFAPQTIYYKYSINKKDKNAYVLDFGDAERDTLNKNKNLISHYFRLPGFYKSVLYSKDGNRDSMNIHILSKGWEPIIIKGLSPIPTINNVAHPSSRKTLATNNLLLSTKEVQRNSVDTNQVYWTEYRYSNLFDISLDSVSFKTKIKNSIEGGNILCNHVIINLIGETGEMKLHFVKPGCAQWINLIFSENTLLGHESNLHVFEQDFSNWKNVQLDVFYKRVKVYIEDKKIYSLPYLKSVGNVKCIKMSFSGCGEIEYIAFFNKKNQNLFESKFSTFVPK